MRFRLLFLFVTLFTLSMASAQSNDTSSDSTKYRVVKNNGVEYIGYILSDDGREVLIQTDNMGKIYIPKSEITSIRKVNNEIDYRRGEYIGEGVFTTRYQFSTNALPIKKGEHYGLLNLFGPEVHFAVRDNFSVGVMATWIASPIALALKYTIPTKNEKLNFGFGTLIGSSAFLNQARGFGGLHWAMLTYGDRRNNITLSAGYGYLDGGNGGRDRVIPAGVYYPQIDPWIGVVGFQYPYGERAGSGFYKSPVVGLAGVFAVNSRTSFVIDIIASFATRNGVYQTVEYSNTNWIDSEFAVVSDVLNYQEKSNNFVFMPGMRFQKTEKSAFQVSIAGILGKRSYRENFSYFNSYYAEYGEPRALVNTYSFPFPMFTWYFKF
jgi:hypothetical protein